MTVKNLGQYGTIDDISIEELLDQKGVENKTPWEGRKTSTRGRKVQFATDDIGAEETINVNLGKIIIPVPRVAVKKRNVLNVLVYETAYPYELIAIYVNPHNGITGISLRKHNHTYFDAQESAIMEALREHGMGEGAAKFISDMNFRCTTIDAFMISPDGEDYESLGHLTYLPGLGPKEDISEWFMIDVYQGAQGLGIGTALEKAMMKEQKKTRLIIINGAMPSAIRYYAKKGYGFYRFNPKAEYNKPHMEMTGHIMAKVFDDNIIQLETRGHLDWSKDTTQPRVLTGSEQRPFI
jgi:GNAT superfamily N-acetyltransferase